MALHLGRSLCCSRLLVRKGLLQSYARKTTSSAWKEEQDKYFKINEDLKRPTSPHIMIYRFPLPALVSITHRASGIALYTGLAMFGMGMTLRPDNLEQTLDLVRSLSYGPGMLLLTKLCIAWPFCFHTMNGFRHMVWDTGRGVDLKTMYSTGYAVIALSTLTALGLAFM